MFDLCSLVHGRWVWENGFRGSKIDLNVEALRGTPYPRHLTLMSLGVLMSLGDMPSCRHPFMYAQEATRLSSLLETVCVELLITIVLPGDVSRLGLDIG